MSIYTIKVTPSKGEPFVMDYQNAERFSVAVNNYKMNGIQFECDRSLVIPVSMRLSNRAHYSGD